MISKLYLRENCPPTYLVKRRTSTVVRICNFPSHYREKHLVRITRNIKQETGKVDDGAVRNTIVRVHECKLTFDVCYLSSKEDIESSTKQENEVGYRPQETIGRDPSICSR